MKLTIRLSKVDRPIGDLLRPDHGLTGPVDWGGIAGAVLYYGTAYAHPPGWVPFINSGLNGLIPNLNSEGAVAVLFIPVANRWVVYSFGYTAAKLNIAPFERDFGLKVVLNKIDPGKIKSIDSKTVDVIVTNKRTQLSRENRLNDFGFEIDREMLKSLAGRSQDLVFGSVLSGSDTLTISCDVTATGLGQKSVDIMNAYQSKAYQRNYKWIDNIQPVRDESLIGTLNKLLLEQMNRVLAGETEEALQLASPEIIDYNIVDHFRVKGYRSRAEFALPVLEDIVLDLHDHGIDTLTMDDFERYHIDAIHGNTVGRRWPLLDWLVTEVSFRRSHYVSSEGSWYMIGRNFFQDVNTSFANILADANEFADLGNTADKNERDYLSNYAVTVNNKILDRDLFNGYNPRDTIEICDIFEMPGDFIHVKDGASSSKLSHLFNQGKVSAVMLLSDQDYRKSVVDKLSDKPDLAATIGNPVIAGNHTVAFRILKEGARVSLPFFAKVVLRDIRRNIRSMGFHFRLEWVHRVG